MVAVRSSLMALRAGPILAQVKAERAAKLTEQLLTQTPQRSTNVAVAPGVSGTIEPARRRARCMI